MDVVSIQTLANAGITKYVLVGKKGLHKILLPSTTSL